MKYMRKISLALVFISVVAMASGCNLVQVNPEKDRAQVVAEVNGEKVLKGEVLDRMEKEKDSYYLTDEMMGDPEYEDYVLSVKKQILDSIVTEKLLHQKAEEAGFVLTDEMKEEAKKDFEDLKREIAENLKASDEASGEGAEEGKDYEKEALEYINEQLTAMNMTEEEYIELMAQYKPIEKFSEKTLEDVKITDEDIQAFYDEELQAQKKDPSYSETAGVQLYEPERVKVKHILIELPEEKQQEYNNLLKEDKKDEAQEFLDKELKTIRPKAEEALNKAKEDMAAAIKEFNPDNAEIMEEGMSIYRNYPYLPEEYTKAAFELSKGEVSSLVATQYGYFIIKVEERFPEKTYTLEEKKEELEPVVEDHKKTEKWNSLLEEWKKKEVKMYEKRL